MRRAARTMRQAISPRLAMRIVLNILGSERDVVVLLPGIFELLAAQHGKRAAHPAADFLIHPECGCVTSCMVYLKDKDLKGEGAYITSTEGMIRHVMASPKSEFVVATETGILHRMRKLAPDRAYFPVSDEMECKYMKMITMEKLLRSLEEGVFEVKVPEEIARRARLPIERMVSIG